VGRKIDAFQVKNGITEKYVKHEELEKWYGCKRVGIY
jgi:hypothetical protein